MSEDEAKNALGQQALRDVDAIWSVALGEDDTKAQAFIQNKLQEDHSSFENTRGEQQTLFSTENGEFYDPSRYANDALKTQAGRDIYKNAQEVGKSVLSNPEALKKRVENRLQQDLDQLPQRVSEAIDDMAKKNPVEVVIENLEDRAKNIVDTGETVVGMATTPSETFDSIYGEGTSNTVETVGLTTGAIGAVVGAKGITKLPNGKVKVELEGGKSVEVPESVAYDNKGIYDPKAVKEYMDNKYGAQNVAKHSIDPETGRSVVETTAGQKGGWNKILNKDLDPNTDYKVGDTTYKTDAHGRVKETSYTVSNETSDRNGYQQSKAGKTDGYKDGQTNDQGGHLQATTHGGAGEQINVLPQDAKLNNSEWKKMENSWTKAANEGKRVEVTIKPIYEGSSKRPSEFRVKYKIDGIEYKEKFPNGGN